MILSRLAHKSSFWARSATVSAKRDRTRKPSERLWESLDSLLSATHLEKRSAVFVVKDKKALIGVGCVWGIWRGGGTGNFDARPISPVFLLIAFHEGSSPWSKNGFTQICSSQMCRKSINLRNKYWAKVVNAIFAKSFTPPMKMWHLSSLPHIYSAVFTFLRYICMERICANPLFFVQCRC